MKIYIGSDHAGFELKGKLIEYLKDLGHEVIDQGAFEYNPDDDYPDFVKLAPGSWGIVIGKSGQGEAMCANRVKGIRAAVYYGGNTEIIKLAREHNNANVLSLGAGFVEPGAAMEAVKLFLETPFSGDERHIRRIEKLDD